MRKQYASFKSHALSLFLKQEIDAGLSDMQKPLVVHKNKELYNSST